jgi:hypothetical protein
MVLIQVIMVIHESPLEQLSLVLILSIHNDLILILNEFQVLVIILMFILLIIILVILLIVPVIVEFLIVKT